MTFRPLKKQLTRRGFLKGLAATAAGLAATDLLGTLGCTGEPNAGQEPLNTLLPQRTLGRTGARVSILGLGGAGMLALSQDTDQVGAVLQAALDGGITYFDTAHNYGKDGQSEKNLSLIMSTPARNRVFLASKTGDRTYDGAMRQVELSLKRLGTDHLDLIHVHHVYKNDDVKKFGQPDGVIPALQKLRDQKVVRFIGMTGHPDYAPVAEALAMYEWDTFMAFVNPARFSRPAFEQQIPLARKYNAGIIAMKVYGGSPGKLVGTEPGMAQPTPLLRWALSQDITLAIPAVDSVEQLQQNLDVVRNFTPMTPAELAQVDRQVNAPEKGWRETHNDLLYWMQDSAYA